MNWEAMIRPNRKLTLQTCNYRTKQLLLLVILNSIVILRILFLTTFTMLSVFSFMFISTKPKSTKTDFNAER